MRFTQGFTHFAKWTAHAAGQPVTFSLAVALLLVWAVTGPVFHYNDSWQLVINTATTIITFLMVFLIQNTQNRDAVAMHLKLDELIRAVHGARNRLMDLEDLTEEELEQLRSRYVKLAESAKTTIENRRSDRQPKGSEKKSGRQG
jgi:low affinity Fe/Cu permease